MLADNPRVPVTATRRRAFTVIELLVVMAVVGVLLSLLVVSISAATRTGQSANTRHLMAAIKQGLVRFRADIGYLPPVLGDVTPTYPADPANHDLRKLFDPRGETRDGNGNLIWGNFDDVLPDQPAAGGGFQVNSAYAINIQEWYSVTSLPEYLVGYGNHQQDGFGFVPGLTQYDGEKPALGIRHPDADGVWGGTVYQGDGAANGSLADRMRYPGGGGATPSNVDNGPVYGPYIDLKDDRLLASADVDANGKLVLAFPGEGGYDDRKPKVLVDYWGNPIRYYRRLYAPGALAQDYRPAAMASSGQPVKPPTLADVYLLRPFKISPGSAIDGIPDNLPPPVGPDPSTTTSLRSAEFALFSPGLDKSLNDQVRYDAVDANGDGRPDYFNEDNIVETGP